MNSLRSNLLCLHRKETDPLLPIEPWLDREAIFTRRVSRLAESSGLQVDMAELASRKYPWLSLQHAWRLVRVKPKLYDTKELLETIIDGWLLGVYDDGIDELDVSQLEGLMSQSRMERLLWDCFGCGWKSVEKKKTYFKLRLLVVDPGVRGRGIGSKLLEASQQFAMSEASVDKTAVWLY
jgi:GNAT superfamily N-acetyltransferase